MPERHVVFAGEPPAAVQTARAATAARRRYDPADDFSEPSEHPHPPVKRAAGSYDYNPWEARDREIDKYMDEYRLNIEANIGPFETSWDGPFTLIAPVKQAWDFHER